MPARRLAAAFLLVLAAAGARAVELEGFAVPDSEEVRGERLLLNGAAVRRVAFFKMEVAALYLPERQHAAEAVAALPGAKRLRIVLLRDVDNRLLAKKFRSDLVGVSTSQEWTEVERNVGVLVDSFGGAPLRRGDVITLDWLPGTGLAPSHNGRALAAPIGGELLYQLVLRVFVGPSADAETRARLLGLDR
ncbi:MAG: chalcone isomerase family protein [Ramlibacter sp.]